MTYPFLNIYIIRIHNVLPPVVMNSIDATGGLGQMCQPPHMMLADVAVAPFAGVDLSS